MDKQDKIKFLQELKVINDEYSDRLGESSSRLVTVSQRLEILREKVDKLPDFVESTNEAFEKYTSLTKTDVSFLMFAVALQSTRQFLLNLFKERLSDKEAADKNPFHGEEHSNRNSKNYYASIEEIQTNPVPFDSVQKEDIVKRNDNPKINGLNHRFKALGHDPYLGFIFGTANIMTSTITITEGNFKLSSYHIHSGTNYTLEGKPYLIDKLSARASTSLIFEKIYERIKNDRKEGLKALVYSIWKEWVHLHSDIRSSKSLPLPLLSIVSPNLTHILNQLEMDYLTLKVVEKEYVLSTIIDMIISVLYSFCYNKNKDVSETFHQAKRLKILMYSNQLATTSSAIQMWVKMACGNLKSFKHFDFGGAINTLHQTFKSPIKIAEIQHEFLLNQTENYLKL